MMMMTAVDSRYREVRHSLPHGVRAHARSGSHGRGQRRQDSSASRTALDRAGGRGLLPAHIRRSCIRELDTRHLPGTHNSERVASSAALAHLAIRWFDAGICKIAYMIGWSPHESQQQPKRRGSAQFSLKDLGEMSVGSAPAAGGAGGANKCCGGEQHQQQQHEESGSDDGGSTRTSCDRPLNDTSNSDTTPPRS